MDLGVPMFQETSIFFSHLSSKLWGTRVGSKISPTIVKGVADLTEEHGPHITAPGSFYTQNFCRKLTSDLPTQIFMWSNVRVDFPRENLEKILEFPPSCEAGHLSLRQFILQVFQQSTWEGLSTLGISWFYQLTYLRGTWFFICTLWSFDIAITSLECIIMLKLDNHSYEQVQVLSVSSIKGAFSLAMISSQRVNLLGASYLQMQNFLKPCLIANR